MTLILWLVSVYAAICVAAYFSNRFFMYFPDPTRVAPVEVGLNGVKEIEIAVADGTTLTAWDASPKDCVTKEQVTGTNEFRKPK